jgi:hypothetical protein
MYGAPSVLPPLTNKRLHPSKTQHFLFNITAIRGEQSGAFINLIQELTLNDLHRRRTVCQLSLY